MWIQSHSGEIMNLDIVSSVHIESYKEKYLIWADGGDSLIACYSTEKAASVALNGLIQAIKDNDAFYKIPKFGSL